LSFCDGEGGRLLAHCFGDCQFNEIVVALVEYGLLDDDDAALDAPSPVVSRQQGDSEQRRRKIEQAREIYAAGVQDKRIGIYLLSRGIHVGSEVLRFLEQAPHRLGARLPAMVAPIVDAAGEQIGTHLTYLRPDGSGKANLPKEYQRESRGAIKGGAIRLNGYQGDIILAEGIETALSATELFHEPCWATVCAEGLRSVALPDYVTRIIIAAGHDEAGRQCALAARDRWTVEGRAVRVKVPPIPGQDFNDVLLGRRRNAAGS
jgi:hypothetical protein